MLKTEVCDTENSFARRVRVIAVFNSSSHNDTDRPAGAASADSNCMHSPSGDRVAATADAEFSLRKATPANILRMYFCRRMMSLELPSSSSKSSSPTK